MCCTCCIRGISVWIIIGDFVASISEVLLGKSRSNNGNSSNDDHSNPNRQKNKAVDEGEASVLNAFEAEADATDDQSGNRENHKHNEYFIRGILDINIFLTQLIHNVGVSEYDWESDHDDGCNNS